MVLRYDFFESVGIEGSRGIFLALGWRRVECRCELIWGLWRSEFFDSDFGGFLLVVEAGFCLWVLLVSGHCFAVFLF